MLNNERTKVIEDRVIEHKEGGNSNNNDIMAFRPKMTKLYIVFPIVGPCPKSVNHCCFPIVFL